jgi:amino acid adenylation domain-containing protein
MAQSALLERLHHTVLRTPHAAAFDFDGELTSYAAFAARAQGIRDILDRECAPDDRFVAVWGTQKLDTYAAVLGILASGRAYVPLNPTAPADRNLSCLQQAGAKTIVVAGDAPVLDEWERQLGIAVIRTDRVPSAAWLEPANVKPDDYAYLLFTSGSTGIPKGVPIHHRNLDAFLRAVTEHTDWNVGAQDRVLQMFELTFDLSVMSYALPLMAGGCCVVPGEGGGGFVSISRTLRRGGVTVALMVPSVLAFLERYFEELHFPQLRLSMFCGEALPARLARAWWECAPNARLLNVYGPTEATIFMSAYELSRNVALDEAYHGVVGIGEPLAGSAFRVVDDELREVGEGMKGELVLLGAQVTSGYWRNPERTASAFVLLPDGAAGYRSGDIVVRQGRQHHYVGRVDHQLKIDGYRVEAGEIESKARGISGVRDAVLVPERRDGRVIALHLVVLSDFTDAAFPLECRRTLQTELPSYMVPKKVHVRSVFPLNSNGKVDRNALAADLSLG